LDGFGPDVLSCYLASSWSFPRFFRSSSLCFYDGELGRLHFNDIFYVSQKKVRSDPISPSVIFASIAFYLAAIIAIAYAIKRSPDLQTKWLSSPMIYVLTLAVYCTSWSLFGVIGMATRSGLLFLPVYLGPTLAAMLGAPIVAKLVAMKDLHHITNLADLMVHRYKNCTALGVITTLIALVGTIPYAALQFKSISATFRILSDSSTQYFEFAIVVIIILVTIFLGIRKLDATERHPALMLTIAFESIVKLAIAFLASLFLVYIFSDKFSSLGEIFAATEWKPFSFAENNQFGFFSWMIYISLSASAAIFLPRQFHVAVVENTNPLHIRTAAWLFPVYLFLIAFSIVPLTIVGLSAQLSTDQADTFLIRLPLLAGNAPLALLVFIAGFSASSGMIMIETIALSTMTSNHLIIPAASRFLWLRYLTRNILKVRWAVAAIFIFSAYEYTHLVGDNYPLAQMGMNSFAAFFLFVPPVVAGLYWERASSKGALIGLLAGFGAWVYLLFLPTFLQMTEAGSLFLEIGPWGIGALRPAEFLGIETLDPVCRTTFVALLLNCSGLIFGSLLFPDKRLGNESEGALSDLPRFRKLTEEFDSGMVILISDKLAALERLLQNYYGAQEAHDVAVSIFEKRGIRETDVILPVAALIEIIRDIETYLSGIIGVASAHQVLISAGFITQEEQKAVSDIYGTLLSEMHISPAEMRRKLDYFSEREAILASQTDLLEVKLAERDVENEEKNAKIFDANRKLEASLAELKAAQVMLLESSKFAALGEMAGGIAHEINTPLGTIQLLSSELREALEADPAEVDFAKRLNAQIENTTVRIAAIIHGLRHFSRDAGQDPFIEIELATILHDTLPFCLDRFKIEGIRVLFLPPQTSILISARPVQLSQVFLNILNNARDAIRNLDDKWITIEVAAEGGLATVSFTDSGLGISKEVQDKIFQPFFTTKPTGEGTGLGLSVSKGIIELHKGSIRVDGTCKNTRMIVTLPYRRS